MSLGFVADLLGGDRLASGLGIISFNGYVRGTTQSGVPSTIPPRDPEEMSSLSHRLLILALVARTTA